MGELGEVNNELSGGHVAGMVVQAGVVHGGVRYDAATHARVADERALREDRLSAYASFLNSAEALAAQLQNTAVLSEELVRKIWSPRDLDMLRANLEIDGDSLSKLRPYKYAVQMVGPESAYYAACSVSANLVALCCSSNIVREKRVVVPRRWERNHDRLQEAVSDRLSKFRDEIRKVREASPV